MCVCVFFSRFVFLIFSLFPQPFLQPPVGLKEGLWKTTKTTNCQGKRTGCAVEKVFETSGTHRARNYRHRANDERPAEEQSAGVLQIIWKQHTPFFSLEQSLVFFFVVVAVPESFVPPSKPMTHPTAATSTLHLERGDVCLFFSHREVTSHFPIIISQIFFPPSPKMSKQNELRV